MTGRGLLLAGLGLLLLTLDLPWAGVDLTPDPVGYVLLLLAGRDLGSRVLVVAPVVALPLHLVGYGGLLGWVHDGGYGWWYATAAGSLVLEGVLALAVLAVLRRPYPPRPAALAPRRWSWLVPAAATAYGIGVLVAAALLAFADPGALLPGTGLALLLPLADLAQLGLAVVALVAAGADPNAEGRPRRSGSALR